jgi:hypothetical protein
MKFNKLRLKSTFTSGRTASGATTPMLEWLGDHTHVDSVYALSVMA